MVRVGREVRQGPRARSEEVAGLEAARLGVAVSGGSDYHDDQSHGGVSIGSVSLPREAYERLRKLKT